MSLLSSPTVTSCYHPNPLLLAYPVEHNLILYTIFKMRIQPILVATLATCAFAKVHGTAPVHTVLIEQSQPETESHLNTRDAPNNLDYRCGPKIGKCPVGTCCSGSGMCQNCVRLSSLLMKFPR